jgi:hypothetical protein
MGARDSTKTREIRNRIFLDIIFLLKKLKYSLAARQNARCSQQAQRASFSSCSEYKGIHYTRRLSQTTFNETSNKNLH